MWVRLLGELLAKVFWLLLRWIYLRQLALFSFAQADVGCKAAIQAMHSVFTDENMEAVLLVDGSNV